MFNSKAVKCIVNSTHSIYMHLAYRIKLVAFQIFFDLKISRELNSRWNVCKSPVGETLLKRWINRMLLVYECVKVPLVCCRRQLQLCLA